MNANSSVSLSSGQVGFLATLACLEECAAPKPGNVHRSADFEDVSFYDFQTSAVCLGATIDQCHNESLGKTILQAVQQTKQAVGTNTNLGLILLLVPLAKAVQATFESSEPPRITTAAIGKVLEKITEEDGQLVFEAIRQANPGGLGKANGKADGQDVQESHESIDLLTAMKSAADRDSIARQYANEFHDVIQVGPRLLNIGANWFPHRADAIVFAHVAWLAIQGDSLIARKNDATMNETARTRAGACLESIWKQAPDALLSGELPECSPSPDSMEQFWNHVAEFDFWLRSDGHRRNPGTTADLIGASLFVERVHSCRWNP